MNIDSLEKTISIKYRFVANWFKYKNHVFSGENLSQNFSEFLYKFYNFFKSFQIFLYKLEHFSENIKRYEKVYIFSTILDLKYFKISHSIISKDNVKSEEI